MNKSTKRKTSKSSLDSLLTFLGTLPGILTGIAAILTAAAGLYLAFGSRPQDHGNSQPPPSPTPFVSPTPEDRFAGCVEQEFPQADELEEGTFDAILHLRDHVIRVKFTHNGKPLGAMSLRLYAEENPPLLKIERIVDSQCNAIQDFSNTDRPGMDGMQSYDHLRVGFGGHDYVLRPGIDGGRISATFEKGLK